MKQSRLKIRLENGCKKDFVFKLVGSFPDEQIDFNLFENSYKCPWKPNVWSLLGRVKNFHNLHWRVFFHSEKSGRSITAAPDKISIQTLFEDIDKGWNCGAVGVSIISNNRKCPEVTIVSAIIESPYKHDLTRTLYIILGDIGFFRFTSGFSDTSGYRKWSEPPPRHNFNLCLCLKKSLAGYLVWGGRDWAPRFFWMKKKLVTVCKLRMKFLCSQTFSES